jgi:hypothetical protein
MEQNDRVRLPHRGEDGKGSITFRLLESDKIDYDSESGWHEERTNWSAMVYVKGLWDGRRWFVLILEHSIVIYLYDARLSPWLLFPFFFETQENTGIAPS